MYELLPVKRTVKNQKILATSNRNVAGCFLVVPLAGEAGQQRIPAADAEKGIPCHYVKCCPAFGQRTVT